MSETDTQATGAVAPSAEDTVTTQPSEASEQTVETPEVTPTQSEEAPSPDTVTEKLFAGKYKTVEDLENAYKNAESKLGETASEKAELTRFLNEAFLAPEPAKPEQREDTEADDYQEEDVRSINPDEKVSRDIAVMKFVMMHSDADPAAMNEVLTKDPLVSQIPGYDNKLAYAYTVSQAASQKKAVEAARKEGYSQAQVKAAEKEVAKVETAQKAEPVDEGAELMSKAQNGSPSERQAAREALIRKHLTNL